MTGSPDPLDLLLAPLAARLAPIVAELVVAGLRGAERAGHAPLVDKRELARALAVSVATVDRLCRADSDAPIPFVIVGDSRRFDLAAVRAALESRPAERPKAQAPLAEVPHGGVTRRSRPRA